MRLLLAFHPLGAYSSYQVIIPVLLGKSFALPNGSA